jgi:ssDNA-binding Zn-finger/Zn-ribbon topoisomerase 1
MVNGNKIEHELYSKKIYERISEYKMNLEKLEYLKENGKNGDKTDESCPNCNGIMIVRYSQKTNNTFLGCSNFPKCTTTMDRGVNSHYGGLNHSLHLVANEMVKAMILHDDGEWDQGGDGK